MGGSIGFTIREKNGREHRMSRWTNSFPFFLNNVKFIEEDEAHLREYLQVWYGMVEAYASGDLTEAPMADAYVPNAGMFPCEYGLIVVDYHTMTILQCQSYSPIGLLDTGSAWRAIKSKWGSGDHEHDQEERQRYESLFSSNRIIKAMRYEDLVEVEVKEFSIEQFLEGYLTDAEKYCSATVDMSPWKLVTFKSDRKGFEEMRNRLDAMGFVLTEKEQKNWNEFLEHR